MSPRAAGQLLHVLGEGLCAKLEPFHHGKVGEQLSRQVCHGHAVADRQRGGLDDLAGIGGQHLRAQQSSGIFVGYQFDEATGVEVGERPGHVVERECAAVSDDAKLFRLGFAEAHCSYLRIGEHHSGHGREIQCRIAPSHVDRGAGARSRCHIYELRRIGAVARGKDVWYGSAQVIVHDDRATRIHGYAGTVEVEPRCIWFAAGRDEQLVAVRDKIVDLQCMEAALARLVGECATSRERVCCPLIAALQRTTDSPG